MESSTIGPVTTRERIQTIDIIRAFALIGVVVANFSDDGPGGGWMGYLDHVTHWSVRFFVKDKAMSIYCFLFGLGFAIQLVRAQERNAPVVFMFIRRLVSLFIIGIIALILTDLTIPHEYAMVGVLLLLFYKVPVKFLPALALVCVLVPFARQVIIQQQALAKVKKIHLVKIDSNLLNSYKGVYQINQELVTVIVKKDSQLVIEAPRWKSDLPAKSDSEFVRPGDGAIFTFGKDLKGNVTKLTVYAPDHKSIYFAWPKIQADLQQALKTQIRKRDEYYQFTSYPQASPSYKEYVKNSANKIWDRFRHWSWSDFFWGGDIETILSYFLIGLYVGRRKIFYDISSHIEFLNNVMWWGFAIGVTGLSLSMGNQIWNLVHGVRWYQISQATGEWFGFSWSTGVMAMALAYVAGLTLLLEKAAWKKRLAFLAPVGRMGFTNYLIGAALYVCILPCGLQLEGKIGRFYCLLISLAVYAISIPLSRWWFKHFVMGPAEWLWRSATYWKLQPMRIRK